MCYQLRKQNVRDVAAPPHAAVHRSTTIYELVRASGHFLLPQTFHDDISNGSRIITLTNTQTHPPTNRHY